MASWHPAPFLSDVFYKGWEQGKEAGQWAWGGYTLDGVGAAL